MTPDEFDDHIATAAGRLSAIAASLYYTLALDKGGDVGVVYEALTPAYRRYLESIVAVALKTAALWRGVTQAPRPPDPEALPARGLSLVVRRPERP